MKIFKLLSAIALLCLPVSAVAGQCSKFGSPSFSADRTFKAGSKSFRSKVYVNGANVREESSRGGQVNVKIFTRKGMIAYDPKSKKGFFLKAPPKKLRKGARRVEEKKVGKNIELTSYIKTKSGKWILDAQTVCSSNGVALRHKYVSVTDKKMVPITVTQTNIKLGPHSASIFKAPKDIEIKGR